MDSLLEQSQRVGAALRARAASVCAAESCTGGLVLSALTDVAGSSDYVLGGVVAYSNAAKIALLGVPEATLLAHGAVSAPTAQAMAEGALRLFGATFALSVTGIAGPGGGTPEKPVGLVYVALASAQGVRVERFVWAGDRIANKRASAAAALELLLAACSQL